MRQDACRQHFIHHAPRAKIASTSTFGSIRSRPPRHHLLEAALIERLTGADRCTASPVLKHKWRDRWRCLQVHWPAAAGGAVQEQRAEYSSSLRQPSCRLCNQDATCGCTPVQWSIPQRYMCGLLIICSASVNKVLRTSVKPAPGISSSQLVSYICTHVSANGYNYVVGLRAHLPRRKRTTAAYSSHMATPSLNNLSTKIEWTLSQASRDVHHGVNNTYRASPFSTSHPHRTNSSGAQDVLVAD